jgi:hypothetical protein
MKNLIFIGLLVLSGCANFGNTKTNIVIPEQIVSGECEKEVHELSGKDGKSLITYINSLIDKVTICRIEKKAVVDLLREKFDDQK